MKATTVILSGLLAAATVPPAHADDWLPAKQGATLLGTTAVGVVLGGPLGMVAGAVIGNYLADSQGDAFERGEQLTATRNQLNSAENRIASLESDLDAARASNEQYAQLVLDQLQLEMLFRTDETELTPTGHMRLATLAEFLSANPQISIRLDGYADPRGDASYNQQLSLGRVSHVERVLIDRGVDPSRIESFSHGDSESTAKEGDYDAYALERSVKIELSQPTITGFARAD